MRTNQHNDIMKQGQLPRKETRKMCCLDNQSEYFQLSRTKTGGNGRKEDGENRYIQVIKKMSPYVVGGLKRLDANIFKSLIRVVNR